MKVLFDKFPVDLFLCMICSALLLPLVFFKIEEPIRIILGVPFILFIPGYVLIAALFSYIKPGSRVTVIERIALSFGVSIAIVPLIGLGLNFSPWGIRLEPMLLSLSVFIFGFGLFAMYRWYSTAPDERFSISIDVKLPVFKNRFDKIVTILLAALIIISVILLLYVILVPKIGEKFTDFYVLGPSGKAEDYPQNLSEGENTTVVIGISNHEYRDVTYTVQIWILNQSTYYNETEGTNKTRIEQMWFVDEISPIELGHVPIDIDSPIEPQWQYNYSFSIQKQGAFKLVFLLFTTPTEHYTPYEDYKNIADQVMSSAYRELHLWITIK
jgi:uncharacterized membrane protein